MKKYISIFKKNLFGSVFIGHMRDPEFIIPHKGDVINITDDQICVWGSEFTGKNLKIHHVCYLYEKCNDETVCEILIYVK